MYGYSYPVIGSERELPFYIIGIGINEQEYHVIRPSGYNFPQIIYCTKGSGRLLVGGNTYSIAPNTAFYLPAYVPHEYYSTDDIWDTHWVTFDGFAVKETLEKLGFTKPFVYNFNNINNLDIIFHKIFLNITTDRIFGQFHSSAILYDYLIEFYRCINNKVTKKNHILLSVIDYIDDNYHNNITLEDLCAIMKVSSQHLCRLFQKHLQMRPTEFISKKRIQEAKKLLLTSDLTVNDISKTVGFHNCNYFCILFKRYEAMSPGGYRKIMR
jgi:YesN/AraC family two-component response regulator